MTARRMKQDKEIEGGVDTPSPPLPQPETLHLLPHTGPAEAGRPVKPIAPSEPLAAAPTVTFSGTIVRNGARFALRETAGVLYPLDSVARAWPFEGEAVRVTGKLDLGTRVLYVNEIERTAPEPVIPYPLPQAQKRYVSP